MTVKTGQIFSDSVLFLPCFLQALVFKVRSYHPCVLSNVRFDVDLPEEEEIQVPGPTTLCLLFVYLLFVCLIFIFCTTGN